jgi:hypothetical protein
MAVSRDLSSLLQKNLDKVRKPDNYDSFKERLMATRPKHKATPIEPSPENRRSIDRSAADTSDTE